MAWRTGEGRFRSGAALEGPLNAADQRQFATLAHLGGVLSVFPPLGLLPALVIYLVYRDRGEFVRDHSQEALNFQITVFLAYIVVWFIGSLADFDTYLSWVVAAFSVVFSVLAALSCGRGENYRYPFTFRFLR